jgi:hypothetical protein
MIQNRIELKAGSESASSGLMASAVFFVIGAGIAAYWMARTLISIQS